jgi:hypothetical protein
VAVSANTPYEKSSPRVQKNSFEGSNEETPPTAFLLHIFSPTEQAFIVSNFDEPRWRESFRSEKGNQNQDDSLHR